MNPSIAQTVAELLLQALLAAQKYAQIQAAAAAQGRVINLDDLKAARAENDVAAHQLDASIAAHGG
ncbi:MAG: hypothetical protein ACSLE9_11070 [Burkholderiaceae bacterium]